MPAIPSTATRFARTPASAQWPRSRSGDLGGRGSCPRIIQRLCKKGTSQHGRVCATTRTLRQFEISEDTDEIPTLAVPLFLDERSYAIDINAAVFGPLFLDKLAIRAIVFLDHVFGCVQGPISVAIDLCVLRLDRQLFESNLRFRDLIVEIPWRTCCPDPSSTNP